MINEAMASGLPIVASRDGGAAETLLVEGRNSFLFDPMQIDSIREAMQRLASSSTKTRREMGVASQRLLADRMPTARFGQGMSRLNTDVQVRHPDPMLARD